NNFGSWPATCGRSAATLSKPGRQVGTTTSIPVPPKTVRLRSTGRPKGPVPDELAVGAQSAGSSGTQPEPAHLADPHRQQFDMDAGAARLVRQSAATPRPHLGKTSGRSGIVGGGGN